MLVWQEEQGTEGRKAPDNKQCVHLFDINNGSTRVGKQKIELLHVPPALLHVVGPGP